MQGKEEEEEEERTASLHLTIHLLSKLDWNTIRNFSQPCSAPTPTSQGLATPPTLISHP